MAMLEVKDLQVYYGVIQACLLYTSSGYEDGYSEESGEYSDGSEETGAYDESGEDAYYGDGY